MDFAPFGILHSTRFYSKLALVVRYTPTGGRGANGSSIRSSKQALRPRSFLTQLAEPRGTLPTANSLWPNRPAT